MLCLIISLWLSVYPLALYATTHDNNHTTAQTAYSAMTQHKVENVLIFISLNLPDQQLKRLYQEAQASKIPTQFFLRELYQGSMQGTTERLKNLNIKAKIDPEWLGCYEIKTVLPTFILLDNQQGPVVLHGAVSLAFAIEQIHQHK